MPYSSNSELPEAVKNKIPSEEGRSLWRRVFNTTAERSGRGESYAFAVAYTALQNAGYKDKDGKYVKMFKAEYQGRQVELDKPFRTPNESKKFAVYVRDGDAVKIVRFGDPDMEIRRDDPEARANFRARHSCDTAKDKTTPRYWSCRMWDSESVSDLTKSDEAQIKIDAEIKKSDDELRCVYGWASVVENSDQTVVDWHDDVITVEDIVEAAHDYVTNSRKAKVMHNGGAIGHVVESLVFTKEIQEALGINLNKVGWFIGMKITDDEYYARVKSGEYKMFSIGGMGQRMELDD